MSIEVPEDVARIALSFALVYAVVIAVDYFLQFAVVVPSLRADETDGLTLLTQYNPHGLFITLESVGYFAMSVAILFAAAVFSPMPIMCHRGG